MASSRSGRGFVFTLEAGLALLCLFMLFSSLGGIGFHEYSEVVLYKQAGDYAQIAMKLGCERNETCRAELLSMLGRNPSGTKCAVVERTVVSPDMEFGKEAFTLCV